MPSFETVIQCIRENFYDLITCQFDFQAFQKVGKIYFIKRNEGI